MSFTKDLKRFASNSKEKMNEVSRKASFRLAAQITLKSPVDSGRFRSNWVGALGGVDSTTFTETNRDSLGQVSVLLRGKSVTDAAFYFTNSLPYAKRLEYAWSDQAPNGMVRLSVRNWNRYVQEEIARLR